MYYKYALRSKNGKPLAGANTIKEITDLKEFYERNEPAYKPCTIKNNVTEATI